MSSQSESTYDRYLTKKTSFDCIQTGTVGKSLKIHFMWCLHFFSRPDIKKVMSFLINSLVLGIFKKKFHYVPYAYY